MEKVLLQTQDPEELRSWVRDAIPEHLGVYDATEEEVEGIASRPIFAPWTFANVISRRSQTGWSTHGHSAADVNIYTSDAKVARSLMGSHENTEVGEFLSKYLDVDVAAITEELNLKGVEWDETDSEGKVSKSWTGAIPGENERLDKQDHLDHYSGAHKRCELCGH